MRTILTALRPVPILGDLIILGVVPGAVVSVRVDDGETCELDSGAVEDDAAPEVELLDNGEIGDVDAGPVDDDDVDVEAWGTDDDTAFTRAFRVTISLSFCFCNSCVSSLPDEASNALP